MAVGKDEAGGQTEQGKTPKGQGEKSSEEVNDEEVGEESSRWKVISVLWAIVSMEYTARSLNLVINKFIKRSV